MSGSPHQGHTPAPASAVAALAAVILFVAFLLLPKVLDVSPRPAPGVSAPGSTTTEAIEPAELVRHPLPSANISAQPFDG